MTKPQSKPPILRASIDSRSLSIELFGSGRSRHQRKLVYNYLATYANSDGTSAYPSLTTIAKDNGLTRKGVIGIIQWLEDHRLLRKNDERSPRNTNNYAVLFSSEDQARCREALKHDEQEQERIEKAERAHRGRVLGGQKAAAKRKQGSDSQRLPAESEMVIHNGYQGLGIHNGDQGGDSRAEMVTDELPDSDSQRLHDRPCLPSVESPIPSEQPSGVRWFVRLTSDLLSKSFGQVLTPTDEDTEFILSRIVRAPDGFWYVPSIHRYCLTKRWGGIENPRGVWTVFKREIDGARSLWPTKHEIDDFVETYETRLTSLLSNARISPSLAAGLVMCATPDNDSAPNFMALTDFVYEGLPILDQAYEETLFQ